MVSQLRFVRQLNPFSPFFPPRAGRALVRNGTTPADCPIKQSIGTGEELGMQLSGEEFPTHGQHHKRKRKNGYWNAAASELLPII